MVEVVGGIGVRIAADAGQFQAELLQLSNSIRAAAGRIERSFSGMSGAIVRDSTVAGAAVDQLGNRFTAFGRKADQIFSGAAARFRLFARDVRSFSGTLSVVGGFGGFLSARHFVDTAGGLEQNLEIIRTLASATDAEIQGLSDQIVRLGADTAKSAFEISEGALVLNQMGRSIAEITQILPAMTNFAIASNRSMEDTARTAGATLTQFQLATTETTRVMDLLMRGANQSQAEVGEFAIALTYAATEAFNANVSLERTIALMETLSQGGIPGSRLGTGLQSLLNDIYMPNYRQVELFRRFGIETRTATGEARDLLEVLEDIFTKLPQNMYGRFEVDTARMLMTLRGQGLDAVRSRELDLQLNSAGEAARTADARMRGLKGAIEQLGGAVDSLLIKIGASGFLKEATNVIRAVGQWIQGLSEAQIQTVALVGAIGALVIAIGPLLFALGAVLTLLTSREGIIFALVAAVGAAMVWNRIAAEVRGVQQAMEAAEGPMKRIAEINGQLATATGAAADNLRRLRQEQIAILRQQNDEAWAAFDDIQGEYVPKNRRGGWIWDVQQGMQGLWSDTLTERYHEARARALESARALQRALAASTASDEAIAAAQGATTGTGGSPVPPTTDPAMMGMGPSAAQQRARDIADLRALAAAADQGIDAYERLAAAQQLFNQARDSGEAISMDVALRYADEQRELERVIADRLAGQQSLDDMVREDAQLIWEQGQAVDQFRDEIRRTAIQQRELAAAAGVSADAYERLRMVFDLMEQNSWMSRGEAEEVAARMHAQNRMLDRAIERMQTLQRAAEDMGDTIAQAFENAIFQGGKLKDIIGALIIDIARIAFRSAITEPLGNALGNVLTSIFAGGRAVGGPVNAGAAYMVGEKGPEIFAPRVSGAIIPNHQAAAAMGGGGVTIDARAFVDAKGADPAAIARLEAAMAKRDAELPTRIRTGIIDLRTRKGI